MMTTDRSIADVQFTNSLVDDVFVESAMPPVGAAPKPNPIIYVHGGGQGSWAFRNFLSFFAVHGWAGHALNWYGHNGSGVPEGIDLMDRGIADVTQEVAQVAGALDARPILIGHSMGGLAVLKFAETHPVAAVIMVASVVPSETGVADVAFDFVPRQPYPPPPFEIAHRDFFDGISEAEARIHYDRLHLISPRQLADGSCHRVGVDPALLNAPVLAVAGEHDPLCPASQMKMMSDLYGFDFACQPGRGHNLPLEEKWEETAVLIAEWLDRADLKS